MRAGDATRATVRGRIGGVRPWRHADSSEFEVIEADGIPLRRKNFAESYPIAFRTHRGRVHVHAPVELLLPEQGDAREVLRVDGPMSSIVLSLRPRFASGVAHEPRDGGNGLHGEQ